MSKDHTVKDWIIATRPWSFPASAMPVIATIGYLFWKDMDINWLLGIYTVLNVILFHAAGNTWSDYHDFKHGVDRKDTVGGLSITSGQFKPEEIRKFSYFLFAVAIIMGLLLVAMAGLPVLYFGIAGAFFTVLYPWLKYHALGDVDIFITYAILPILGTSYVLTGSVCVEALVLSAPIGLITDGILHSNNTRDMEQDARANIRTFAMLIGVKASVYLYVFEMVFPFVWCLACVILGYLPLGSLLVVAALKPAVANVRQALQYTEKGIQAMIGLDESTAKLQLVFSLSLFVGFIICKITGI